MSSMERIPLLSLFSEAGRRRFYQAVAFAVIFVILIVVIAVLVSKTYSNSVVLPHLDPSSCPQWYRDPHPLILISLDGFRSSYLSLGLTPTLKKLQKYGVSSSALIPAYPSKTFPNHYTIVTGLYPESHGIVSNTFYDPEFDEVFTIKRSVQYEGRWWGGDPIWNTVKKKGLKSATFFWPGSEAPIGGKHPDYYVKYNSSVPFVDRVNAVLKWLTLPESERPKFISLYLHEPDRSGHSFGPQTQEVKDQLKRVDETIKVLIEGLKKRKLLNCVNIMIVSDHGMASIGKEGEIPFEKFFKNASTVLYSPLRNFQQFNIKKEFSDWRDRVEDAFTCASEDFRLYTKEDLPKRLHYSKNKRIGDYVFLFKLGKTFVFPSFTYSLNGNHGYDNDYEAMRGIFIAYGPDFERGILRPAFQNIELYNLMCRLLQVEPSPNNGTKGALELLLKLPPTPLLPPKVISKVTTLGLPENARQKPPDCAVSPFLDGDLATVIKELNQSDVDKRCAPWGLPIPLSDQVLLKEDLLYHPNRISGWSQDIKTTVWSTFTLSARPNVKRLTEAIRWSHDDRIPNKSAPPCSLSNQTSFKNLSFTLEPLVYPGLIKEDDWLALSSLNTNSFPISGFLRHLWQSFFLKFIPMWFDHNGPLHVVVGPIYDKDSDGYMDKEPYLDSSGVAIPSDMFAILVKCVDIVKEIQNCRAEHLEALSFILPQRQRINNCFDENDFFKTFTSRLKDIEQLTGLAFLPKLAPRLRLRLSLQTHSHIWL